jgi:hypothetical protein
VGNKVLHKKWSDKERQIHKDKLKSIKPSVEIGQPANFRHLKSKAKKNQMLEGKVLFLTSRPLH